MRTVSSATTQAWLSGEYTGTARPMVRATIQFLGLVTVPVGEEVYSSIPFGQSDRPVELPNIASVKWKRSTEQDVATCEIELYNTDPLPLGMAPGRDGEFDLPGAYTYTHGMASFSPRWGHTPSGWQDRLAPDRIVRTYEGYGFDATVPPELDPNLYLSGTWLIDDVEYTHDGLITLTCRDVGRALLDQIAFPPVVPVKKYPLRFEAYHQVEKPPIVEGTAPGRVKPTYDFDSNVPYVGVNGAVYGHHGSDAFDTGASLDQTHWMSIGNAKPAGGYAFEFIQGKFPSSELTGVQFLTWAGPYTCYVSVFSDNKWQGSATIPYDPHNPASAPNGANIPYVGALPVGFDSRHLYQFPKSYPNATKVRLTFTNLYNSGMGTYKYRAGVRDMFCTTAGTQITKPDGYKTEGNFDDFSDIVAKLLAYAGFYWPRESGQAFLTRSDGSRVSLPAPTDHPYLGRGRVWGDIERSGAPGAVQTLNERGAVLGVEVWDKKPIMDCIAYLRDILGYIFFVDEGGGAVFRSPNIWSVGNWIGNGGPNSGRTTSVVTIDEDQTLIGLRAKLSSRAYREHIFVANVVGGIAAVSRGIRSTEMDRHPSGLRRTGGWCVDTDTEIFTRRGWLRYDEVQPGDETLSIDEATGETLWQPVREVAIFPAEPRQMLLFQGGTFSALTTAEHRWVVQDPKSMALDRLTADQLVETDRIPLALPRNGLIDVPFAAGFVELGLTPQLVDYDGVVWCPSMPEHHTWLARRHGSAYFTGNSDQHFSNTDDCQIMADLITIRQMFTYRTDSITIPGYPAIQVDDQVRIFERTTSEGYLHYVKSIEMEWSLETGEYIYTLETHWLGQTPFSSWTFNPADLAPVTVQYLQAMGKI